MKLPSINSINFLFEPCFCFSFLLIFLVLSCFIFIVLPFRVSLAMYSYLSISYPLFFHTTLYYHLIVPQFSHSYCWRWHSIFLIYIAENKEQIFYRFVCMFPGRDSFKGLSRTLSNRFSVFYTSWKVLWKNLRRIVELRASFWIS